MNTNTWYARLWQQFGNVFLAVIIVVVGIGFALYVTNQKADKQEKLDAVAAQYSKNGAGRFAVQSFLECMDKGIAGRTKNDCVNEVVTAARNLKGASFAESVGMELSGYLDAVRTIERS